MLPITYTTNLTPTFTRVLENLGLNPEDAVLKDNFLQPELASLEFGSIYEDGRFRLITDNDTVERTQASFDDTETKVITTTIFSIVDTDDYSFVTTNPEAIEEATSIARMFDHYVGARELDYREGVAQNDRVLERLRNLGIANVTYRDITPMFSQTSRDISFNL